MTFIERGLYTGSAEKDRGIPCRPTEGRCQEDRDGVPRRIMGPAVLGSHGGWPQEESVPGPLRSGRHLRFKLPLDRCVGTFLDLDPLSDDLAQPVS